MFSHEETHCSKRFLFIIIFCLQAANTIRSLEGLDRLEHLAKLHLRDNQIEKLDGFSENMKNLQYLNLRWVRLKIVKRDWLF